MSDLAVRNVREKCEWFKIYAIIDHSKIIIEKFTILKLIIRKTWKVNNI